MKIIKIVHSTPALLLVFVATMAAQTIPRKAPDFSSDATWIDGSHSGEKVPHSIKGYRGHVLLIDFWEFTCINCIRDFSVLKDWYAKYHSYGFEIVGVHYGEFQMGFKVENVRDAAKRFQLPWPVVADMSGSIWNAYHSDVWPNRYLVDPEGNIVMQLKGEGNDRSMEDKIRELLEASHPEVRSIAVSPPENAFSPQCGITTPEMYVGVKYGRSAIANTQFFKDGEITDFRSVSPPPDGKVALDGKWLIEQEGVTSQDKNAHVDLRYHARSVYAVLNVDNPKKPVRVNVLQDSKPLEKGTAGADVKVDAQGSYIEVSEPRMYYVAENSDFSSHLLTLAPENKGFDLHTFTYGNNCQQHFEHK